MSVRLLAVILTIIALSGWCESIPRNGAFIFIEQSPPSTSQDTTTKSTAVYLNEKGLVQRYACEDAKVNDLREGFLPVADIFKTLSAISLMSRPVRPDADPNLPPAQAQPGHARIMVRQSGGAEYLWEGNADNIPADLKKLVQETLALTGKLKSAQPPACIPIESGSIARRPAGAFVRADVLSADRLDEYRVSKLLKTVKILDELDAVLQEALAHPFRLMPVPAGKNPLSAFVIKGESSPLPLLYNGTGYEIKRYPFTPPASP